MVPDERWYGYMPIKAGMWVGVGYTTSLESWQTPAMLAAYPGALVLKGYRGHCIRYEIPRKDIQ